MKRLTAIAVAFAMCISLAGCADDTAETTQTNQAAQTTQTSENAVTETETATSTQDTTAADAIAGMPVNFGEVYSCTVDGVEGFFTVYEYTALPDEMNPGCEIRTAAVAANFQNAPSSFALSAALFPADGTAPEMLEDGVWLTETENGEGLIFAYDNMLLYDSNENGGYYAELIVSFVVPEDYDNIAFTLTSSDSAFDLSQPSALLSADSRWFKMTGVENGVLCSNGIPVSVAKGDADSSAMDILGFAAENMGGYENNIEYYEPEAEQGPVYEAASESLQLVLNYSTARTSATLGGVSNEFESITLVDYSDTSFTVSVKVKYSGVPANAAMSAQVYDASLSDFSLDRQDTTVSGSGTQEFVFTIDRTASVQPYTFTAAVTGHGQSGDMSLFIDATIK